MVDGMISQWDVQSEEARRLVTEYSRWLMRTVCRQPVLLLQADAAADRAAALYEEDHGRFTFKFKLTSLVQRCSVLTSLLIVALWLLCFFRLFVFIFVFLWWLYDLCLLSEPASCFRLRFDVSFSETMAKAGVAFGSVGVTSPSRRDVVMTSTFGSSRGMFMITDSLTLCYNLDTKVSGLVSTQDQF